MTASPDFIEFVQELFAPLGGVSIRRMFGGAGIYSRGVMFGLIDDDTIYLKADNETRKANDLYRIVRELTPEQMKALPFLYLDCGTEDFLIGGNRNFSALLIEKKVPHEFRQLPGGHSWPYWDRQVREILRLAAERLAPPAAAAPTR